MDVTEINAETGEVVERPFTEEEKTQRATDAKDRKAAETSEAKLAKESTAKRETALAKLAALGLTIEDLKALSIGQIENGA